jgi:hypothetical protein
MDESLKARIQKSLESSYQSFRDSDKIRRAKEWLDGNQDSIETLFNHPVLLDFVFEPLKGVFQVPGEGQEKEARQVITRVALVNAVIAGLPGSLGVGVFVSMGLELWMAYALSRVVGLGLTRDEAVETLIGWAIGAGGVLVLFKVVLNLIFPVVTAIMPFVGLGTALTQLIVTNLFGVLFWILFEELKTKRRFKFPMTSISRLGSETVFLLKHQFSAGVGVLDPKKWRLMGERLWSWLTGEVPTNMPALRGELVATVAMAWLISGETEKLSGPLGEEFIGAIRDRFPDLATASIEDIAARMSTYDPEQMAGVVNLVKGKLFERLVERYENGDSDAWQAVLHEDESFPGSDIIFTNGETGEQIEVSLKATDSAAYLENSLARYPDFPIIATDEVAESLQNDPAIWTAGMTNEDLKNVTDENFGRLFETLEPIDATDVVSGGVAAAALIKLWPYVMGYMRGRLSRDKLSAACMRVLPESGKAFASRLVYAAALGPVFAWWLLARGVMLMTPTANEGEPYPIRRLILHAT